MYLGEVARLAAAELVVAGALFHAQVRETCPLREVRDSQGKLELAMAAKGMDDGMQGITREWKVRDSKGARHTRRALHA